MASSEIQGASHSTFDSRIHTIFGRIHIVMLEEAPFSCARTTASLDLMVPQARYTMIAGDFKR